MNIRTKTFLAVILLSAAVLSSCKDDPIVGPSDSVIATGFEKTIDENPVKGYNLGTILGASPLGDVTYSIKSQSVAGAMSVDETSGVVKVANEKLFDFETNPTLTAKIRVTIGADWNEATVTITLNDVLELESVQALLDKGKTPWEISAINAAYKSDSFIGKKYQGGLIYYYSSDRDQGEIVALENAGTAAWGCKGTEISKLLNHHGVGLGNTATIMKECSESGIAARLCDAYSADGFSDWHLPSDDEMGSVFFYFKLFPDIGIKTDDYFWISAQVDADDAYNYWYTGSFGTKQSASKDEKLKVRPVRYFKK